MLEKFDPSRYALSKFYYNIDAYLYSMGADEETGDSEFGGWYGLFAGPFGPSAEDIIEFDLTDDDVQYLSHMAGAILCENSQGFVSSVHYEDNDTLGYEWAKCNKPPSCFHCGEELDDNGMCPECDTEDEDESEEEE